MGHSPADVSSLKESVWDSQLEICLLGFERKTQNSITAVAKCQNNTLLSLGRDGCVDFQ